MLHNESIVKREETTMAYVSKELKSKLAPAIKAVLKKYDMKGTIAVRNHSSLVVNLKSGAIDFDQHATGDDRMKRRGLYEA